VLGIDISADRLRVAKQRSAPLVRADAIQLPFAQESFDTVSATYLHTDVDDIAPIFDEVERVLRPRGRSSTSEHTRASSGTSSNCRMRGRRSSTLGIAPPVGTTTRSTSGNTVADVGWGTGTSHLPISEGR
jgi:SAM-dependent methyltransferase